jgi:hypothetical protein
LFFGISRIGDSNVEVGKSHSVMIISG